jgi:hypothetical protein
LSWFVGVGVVAHWLFNLQFVWFGIGIGEYSVLLVILCVGLFIRIKKTNVSLKDFVATLSISCNMHAVKKSWYDLSIWSKRITWGCIVSILWFLVNSFVFTTQFPTYADDSFSNRNRPVLNILHDGGIKLFGERDEILARWRLWYPVHIAWYKALISEMQWWFNDIYTDLVQWLSVLWLLIFLIVVTREQTKNLFLSVLSPALLISLPLIFIHSVESYHEILSVVYSIVCIRIWWKWIQTHDTSWWILTVIVLWIIAYIKNDWFVVYVPAILLWLFCTLLVMKQLSKVLHFIKDAFVSIILSLLFFGLPFAFLKMYHNLWSNQAAWVESGVWISSTIHWEIFNVIPSLFTQQDNYWLVFIWVALLIYSLLGTKRGDKSLSLFWITPVIMFFVLLLVFLLTENYTFVMNQTTVNRVFTLCFMALFAFLPFFIDAKNHTH